jgi:probable rRNA maturation factor
LFPIDRERAGNDLVIVEKQVAGLSEASLTRFLLRVRKAVGLKAQVNVLVTGSTAVRALNRRFRSQNKPTDVLSFPATSSSSGSPKASKLAGDLAISADIALKNSFRLGHSPVEEIKILVLHGVLHLAGFDHERDNGAMARKEAKLRQMLRLPAALIERMTPERGNPGRSEAAHKNSSNHRRAAQRAAPSTPSRRMA